MNILWSPQAIEDLTSLRAYIAEDDPAAALGIVLRIIHAIEQLLSGHPQMGRPGRVPGTRELVISKTAFIVPYRLQRNIIQILRVYYGARRWPENFQSPVKNVLFS